MRRYAVLLSLVLVSSTTAWGYYISEVTVSPPNPTTLTPVTVKVTGNAPATNYHLDHSTSWQLGTMYFLDMYWTSGTGIGGMALVPYTHEESLGTLAEGSYILYVRSFCDGLMRDSKSVSFKVTKAIVIGPPVWPGVFWNSWWWVGSNGFMSSIQVQAWILGPGEISFDFSVTNSVNPGQ